MDFIASLTSADFDSGYAFDTGRGPSVPQFWPSHQRIVIGQRYQIETARNRLLNQRCWFPSSIGRGGVHVEIGAHGNGKGQANGMSESAR